MFNIRNVILFAFLICLTGCLTLYQAGFPKLDAKRCVQVSEDKNLNEQALNIKSLFEHKDYSSLLELSEEIIYRYNKQAKNLQDSLSEYPWESKTKIFSKGELNLVSLAYFGQAIAHFELNEPKKAKDSAQTLFEDFYYGQCLTDQSVFAKPSEALKEYHDFFKTNEVSTPKLQQ